MTRRSGGVVEELFEVKRAVRLERDDPELGARLGESEHVDIAPVTLGAGELLLEESLKSLEQDFGPRLLRIHRNALVARDRIRGLDRSTGGKAQVILDSCDFRPTASRSIACLHSGSCWNAPSAAGAAPSDASVDSASATTRAVS